MKLLKIVTGFIENLVRLLRYGQMQNLEGFLGGFHIVFGLSSMVAVSRQNPASKVVLLWLAMAVIVGVFMAVGTVQSHYRTRLLGCGGMLIVMFGLTYALILAGQRLWERLPVTFYMIGTLIWLLSRILGEKTKPALEVRQNGGYELAEPPHDVDNLGRRSLSLRGRGVEMAGIPAGAEESG